MELTKIKDNQWNAVRKIYTEAFPKKEQKPFTSLKSSVKKGKTELLTASENDTLLGFTALIPYKDMVMVDYLAVNSAIRSKGTGSRILQNVCNLYSNKKIVLLIEQIDKMAENSQKKILSKKRICFIGYLYKRRKRKHGGFELRRQGIGKGVYGTAKICSRQNILLFFQDSFDMIRIYFV